MIDFYKVGLKIMTYRKKLALTQDDLANQLYVSRQALSKWETGTSGPTVDNLIQLSKLFETTIEDILCLNDERDMHIDINNLFESKQNRMHIINRIIRCEIVVDIPSIFYQLSNTERFMILKAIKEKRLTCDLNDLKVRLTPGEQKFLFNKVYIIGGTNQ